MLLYGKLQLIRTLVVPDPTRACTKKDLEISIVSRKIKRYRKIL